MAGNITFTMIKPAAYAKNYSGKILDIILNNGFRIQAMIVVRLTPPRAGKFYEVHKERPFYDSLVQSMSSGTILAAILEKDNAVEDYRTLIGATNPENAAEGTIRKQFGESVEKNAVHGSDSDANAALEASFFFTEFDRV